MSERRVPMSTAEMGAGMLAQGASSVCGQDAAAAVVMVLGIWSKIGAQDHEVSKASGVGVRISITRRGAPQAGQRPGAERVDGASGMRELHVIGSR